VEVITEILGTTGAAVAVKEAEVGHLLCLIGPSKVRGLPQIRHNCHIVLVIASHQAIMSVCGVCKNLAACPL
jgi:hypothetical protein